MYAYDDIKLILDNARTVPLLSPKKEKELARKIEDTRVQLWSHTLSYTTFASSIIDLLRPHLLEILKRGGVRRELDFTPIDTYQVLAEKDRQKSSKIKIDSQRDEAAKVIASIDRGLEVFEKIHCELLKRNPFGRARPPSNSKKFTNYLEGLNIRLKAHRFFKEQFWRSNIRLAVSLTKKYDHGMIPFADMLQEALIGLMTAVERFEVAKGFRFSTYATWWVRHSLNRFLANHGRTIRWPAHVVADFETIKKARNKIIRRGDYPSVELLAEESGMKINRIQRIVSLNTIQPISLDFAIPGLDNTTLGERLTDESVSIEDNIALDPALEKIESQICKLPGIEGDILIKRFGLDGKDPRTLQQIADEHSLSRERIRQLEKQGLGRLREVIRQ